jgi:hypothetical protein
VGIPAFAALVVGVLGMSVSLRSAETGVPASATVSETEQSAAETAASREVPCEKQAWPYIDKRCAESAAKTASQTTREVRVVSTDRGTSSTIVTPVASDPPKPAATPPRPQESQPAIAESQNTAAQQTAAANSSPLLQPAGLQSSDQSFALAASFQEILPQAASQGVLPQTAGTEPPAPLAATEPEAAPQKSKAAKTSEKRATRTSKWREQNRRPLEIVPSADPSQEQYPSRVPSDVVQAVESATARERTGRAQVPAEVLAAVEADLRRNRGTYGGKRAVVSQKYNSGDAAEMVTVRSGRGQRVFIVPRETDFASEP